MFTKLTLLAFAITVAGSIPVRGQRVPAGEAGADLLPLDGSKHYTLITFREIRAVGQASKHSDRERQFVATFCKGFGGTPFRLTRDPGEPWTMTRFQNVEPVGSNKSEQGKR